MWSLKSNLLEQGIINLKKNRYQFKKRCLIFCDIFFKYLAGVTSKVRYNFRYPIIKYLNSMDHLKFILEQ